MFFDELRACNYGPGAGFNIAGPPFGTGDGTRDAQALALAPGGILVTDAALEPGGFRVGTREFFAFNITETSSVSIRHLPERFRPAAWETLRRRGGFSVIMASPRTP